MLYHLFEYLNNTYELPGSGLFKYISFRAALAVITSLLVSMVFGGCGSHPSAVNESSLGG